jgi:patatin-like phospholipase/acyl hydrolase
MGASTSNGNNNLNDVRIKDNISLNYSKNNLNLKENPTFGKDFFKHDFKNKSCNLEIIEKLESNLIEKHEHNPLNLSEIFYLAKEFRVTIFFINKINDNLNSLKTVKDLKILCGSSTPGVLHELGYALLKSLKNPENKVNNVVELLIDYTIHCLVYGPKDEISYFRHLIRSKSDDFLSSNFETLNNILDDSDPEMLIERLEYLIKNKSSFGRVSFLHQKLKNLKIENNFLKQKVDSFLKKIDYELNLINSEKINLFNDEEQNLKRTFFYLKKSLLKVLVSSTTPEESLFDLSIAYKLNMNNTNSKYYHDINNEIFKFKEIIVKEYFKNFKEKSEEFILSKIEIEFAFGAYDQAITILKENSEYLKPLVIKELEEGLNYYKSQKDKFEEIFFKKEKGCTANGIEICAMPIQNQNQNLVGNFTGNGNNNANENFNQNNNQNNNNDQNNNNQNNNNQNNPNIPDPNNLMLNLNLENGQNSLRVLSIDGGGIKGIFSLYLLAEFEFRTGRKIYELFNFITGTSIGGIIALCFSMKKYSAEVLLRKMLGSFKNNIFAKFFLSKIFGKKVENAIYGLLGYNLYSTPELETILRNEICRDERNNEIRLNYNRLGNCLISVCKVENQKLKPYLFIKYNNFRGLVKVQVEQNGAISFHLENGYNDVFLWEIMRATSAAYPFFSDININGTKFVDGGFIFNNPSYLTYLFLLTKNITPERIKMLSLGLEEESELSNNFNLFSAVNNAYLNLIAEQSHNFFIYINKEELISNMKAISKYCQNETQNLMGERLKRLTPSYAQNIDLDSVDYESIRIMLDASESVILNLDLQINNNSGLLNSIILYFFNLAPNQYIPGTSIRRIRTRYNIFPQSYENLDSLFLNYEQAQTNESKTQIRTQIEKALKSFNFPENISAKEKDIILPSYIFSSPSLTYALTIGHYKSIKLFSERDVTQYIDWYQWNPYHIAIANDEIVSLHYLFCHHFMIENRQHFEHHCLLDFVINEEAMAEEIQEQINHAKIHLERKRTNHWWDLFNFISRSAKEFIEHYNSSNVKKYLDELNKRLIESELVRVID